MNARDPNDIGNSRPLDRPASTKRRKLKGGGPRPMALEQRIVFDGAGVDGAVAATLLADRAALDAASARDVGSDTTQSTAPAAYAAVSPAPTFAASPREIAFIDKRVPDWQKIIDGLNPAIDVILVDGNEDGLGKMLDAVRNGGDSYSAVHIFSHGSSGSLQVGSSILDTGAIDTEHERLTLLGERLSADADILLYGCDVAADASGVAFIGKLARATGADVAASSDLTGTASKGGDWTLEQQTGHIETAVGLSVEAQGSYTDILADNTAPSFRGTAGDGVVTTSLGPAAALGKIVVVQADGKILVAGESTAPNLDGFF
jgi:hypothetical protein